MTHSLAPATQPDRPETPWPDPPDLPRPIAAFWGLALARRAAATRVAWFDAHTATCAGCRQCGVER